jgi:mRNA-degrading endonuclease YafQ of YafQ-DinJ toxin-antitoxin module
MSSELEVTERFKRAFQRKTPQQRDRVRRTLRLLAENPRHSGLQTHRVHGASGVWECYVDRSARVTFEYGSESVLILRNNCGHDAVLRRP